MSDPSAAIIAAVQKNLETMFSKGAVVDIAGDDLSAAYLQKAAATNDPALAAGYRKLAKKAQKVGR